MAQRKQTMTLRERLKDETRQIILDAFASCLGDSDIDKVTYADIANRAGIAQRTIYRHFPAREDLLRGLYNWVGEQSKVRLPLPRKEADLTHNLPAYFSFFDEIFSVAKAVAITPQGHEMRVAMNPDRNAAFMNALAEVSEGLSARDRKLATAAVQQMSGITAWLAMRENWNMTSAEAAEACSWAIRAMLADIRRRQGKPLKD